MKGGWRITLAVMFSLLLGSCSLAEELFSVEEGIVSGRRELTDGFEIILDMPVPEMEFTEQVPKMKAQKYSADAKLLDRVWTSYVSLNGASELDEAQVFVDVDGKIETQYVYSDRATEMANQIVGIRSVYRRRDETIENLDKEATARCILNDLGIEVEYPLYYVAKGDIDYANVQKDSAFIRDTDTIFIARQLIEGYPLATTRRFMHNGVVYTGGFVAVILDDRNNLVYLDLHSIIQGPKNKGEGITCISWQAALEHFLRQKSDFSFETFDERRTSFIESGRMTAYSISPAMIYAEETGEITPIWEIEGKIEFEQVFPDGKRNPICKMHQYHVNAWTGEYLCYDP